MLRGCRRTPPRSLSKIPPTIAKAHVRAVGIADGPLPTGTGAPCEHRPMNHPRAGRTLRRCRRWRSPYERTRGLRAKGRRVEGRRSDRAKGGGAGLGGRSTGRRSIHREPMEPDAGAPEVPDPAAISRYAISRYSRAHLTARLPGGDAPQRGAERPEQRARQRPGDAVRGRSLPAKRSHPHLLAHPCRPGAPWLDPVTQCLGLVQLTQEVGPPPSTLGVALALTLVLPWLFGLPTLRSRVSTPLACTFRMLRCRHRPHHPTAGRLPPPSL